MKHRIATIGIGVRLFEKQGGRLPSSISELGILDIAGEKIDPLALLPPVVTEGEASDEQNKQWVWSLPRKHRWQNCRCQSSPKNRWTGSLDYSFAFTSNRFIFTSSGLCFRYRSAHSRAVAKSF